MTIGAKAYNDWTIEWDELEILRSLIKRYEGRTGKTIGELRMAIIKRIQQLEKIIQS